MVKYTCLLLLAFVPFFGFTQTAMLKGLVRDESGNPLKAVHVSLKGSQQTTQTADNGSFILKDVPYGDELVEFRSEGLQETRIRIQVNQPEVDMGMILLSHENEAPAGDDIPTAALTESDLEGSNSSTSASGVLGASRDAFTSAITFNFSIARFRLRGYEYGYAPTLMNGVPMTDLATGRDMFYTWSGLNDMVRARENSIGLEANYSSYGGLAGSSEIDSRAARQRKQLQVSYAMSNRTYDNRLVLSYGSGILKGGWSIAGSVSRRWAKEGYVKGTFYDSWAYFASVEKELNLSHSLSLTVFGSPLRNGRQSAATQEMYDIAGTHYYNPNWGYQNGNIRNAVVGRSHIPVAILSHEWKIDNSSSLETSLSHLAGKTKISGLDWYNATDPRADFYRRMPGFIALTDPTQASLVYNLLAGNENERQVQWDELYASNYISDSTVYNADGISGNTVSGRWANYLVQDRVTSLRKYGFNTIYNKTVSDHAHVTAGLSYQRQRSEYYKEVNDLLGADFYVDLNQYAEQANIDSIDAVQNDLNHPNRILHTGDRYGYDYVAEISKSTAWAQGVFTQRYIDYFFAGEISSVHYYREGRYRNGVFAGDSYGKSKTQKFTDISVKAGLTYKINGRNYLFANASWLTQAPEFEDTYISPRTRHAQADGLQSETATSAEGGYLLKAPKVKARAVVYTTEIRDQIQTASFYHEDFRTFVNYTLSGIDRRHTGTELALEAVLYQGLSATAVASLGRFIFTNNPSATISQDNKDTLLAENQTVYLRNFHVGGTPEKAMSFGLNYRGRQFWFVNIALNLFDGIYISPNPARRTTEAIDLVDQSTGRYRDIVDQEKVSKQVTVDLSAGKSWRLNNTFKSLKQNMFLVFNAGITNLLNNQNLVSGGFEQLRFDYFDKNPQKFASKYYYGFGTTFFVSVAFRLN